MPDSLTQKTFNDSVSARRKGYEMQLIVTLDQVRERRKTIHPHPPIQLRVRLYDAVTESRIEVCE